MGRKPIWCLSCSHQTRRRIFPNFESPSLPKLPSRGIMEAFHEARRASFSHGERYHRIEGSAMRRPIWSDDACPSQRMDGRGDLTINDCLPCPSSSDRSKAQRGRIAGWTLAVVDDPASIKTLPSISPLATPFFKEGKKLLFRKVSKTLPCQRS